MPIELPWSIPDNWTWVRFGELCWFASGRTPARKEPRYWNTGDYPWFSIADLEHGKTIYKSKETVSEIARDDVFKSEPIKAGSLLMSFKLSIGKLSIMGVDGFHNEAIITIHPFDKSLKSYFLKCMSTFIQTVENKRAIREAPSIRIRFRIF
jgi:type I restriction enzyme S subunit